MPETIVAVLYATQTGVSKSLAENITSLLSKWPFRVELHSFDEALLVDKLCSYRCIIFVCSSTGQGDPPDSATKFYRQLRRLNIEKSTKLSSTRYTILGLGDSNYQTFGAFPKALHKVLKSLGASTFYDFALADDAVGLETVVEPWLNGIVAAVNKELGLSVSATMDASSAAICERKIDGDKTALIGRSLSMPEKGWKLPNIAPSTLEISFGTTAVNVESLEFTKNYYASQTHFGASSPVVRLPIKSVATLTSPAALKPVYEICLNGTCLPTLNTLLPGDSFSILCSNDDSEVTQLLERLGFSEIADMPMTIGPKPPSHLLAKDSPLTLRNCLLFCVDIRSAPKKSFLRLMASSCLGNEKFELEYLSSFEGNPDFSKYVREAQLSILDLLLAFPAIKLTVPQLIENLPPLKARAYSLANYPAAASGSDLRFAFSEVYLPMADSHRQYDRHGVCTQFLLNAISAFEKRTLLDVSLPVFTKSMQSFRLPQDLSVPLLLVSAGTGIAPYIGFLEYIENQKSTGSLVPKEIWLFHGCRNRQADFIYQDKIEGWLKSGLLTKLVLACSRQDPPQHDGSRTYVQNRLSEHGKGLMETNPPPIVYVCGDAAKMAPLLRETLINIIRDHTGVSKEEATQVFKQWTKSGRYKEDVWR